MEKISFENFRKYVDFEPLELLGVNFFVGANNCGKSTATKAMLLAHYNLQKLLMEVPDGTYGVPTFEFNIPNVQLGTYTRAYCNKATGLLNFMYSVEYYGGYSEIGGTYQIGVLPNPQDDTIGNVACISFGARNTYLYFDFVDKTIEICHVTLVCGIPCPAKETVVISMPDFANVRAKKALVPFLLDVVNEAKYDNLSETQKNTLKECKSTLKSYNFDRFEHLEYLYAHSVNQNEFYSIYDTDYLSKIISEYGKLDCDNDPRVREFIVGSLSFFPFCTAIRVDSSDDGVYRTIKVQEDDNITWSSLADKGMGAIQIVAMVYKLAVAIKKAGERNVMAIIEEPEQNLHPAWQSKLADYFLWVYEKYNVQIIVETHSEYIIRRSQVLVKQEVEEEGLSLPPKFVTYYFPANGIPYDMGYRHDGSFSRDFGEGFFDEANKSILQLL